MKLIHFAMSDKWTNRCCALDLVAGCGFVLLCCKNYEKQANNKTF